MREGNQVASQRQEAAKPRVTLSEVALHAGVSVATASKVLNGRANLRLSTREAVTEAAQQLGYEPQRRHVEKPRRSIALHLQGLDSAYEMGVFAGAEYAARRHEVDLLVSSSEGGGLSRAWMTEVAARGVDGVVAVVAPIEASHAQWSRALSLPLIVVDPIIVGGGVEGILTVTATNWEGGVAAVGHLLDLGHRRIGILVGPEGSVPGNQRLEGYFSALNRAGIPLDDELIVHGGFQEHEGEIGVARLLDLQRPPTAIFATSDALALGALRVARERQIAVPEELSVIAFDDTMVTRWTTPQLTAINQPLFSMGQVAVERLLALAADPDSFSHPFKLETRLVERESTAHRIASGSTGASTNL